MFTFHNKCMAIRWNKFHIHSIRSFTSSIHFFFILTQKVVVNSLWLLGKMLNVLVEQTYPLILRHIAWHFSCMFPTTTKWK
jgi:hypothetical protein